MLTMSIAFAAGPERHAATVDVGSSIVRNLSSDSSGEVLAMVVGSSAVVLDVRTWQQTRLNPCTVAGATVVEGVGQELEVWVGCNDGTVRAFAYVEGSMVPIDAVGEEGVVQALNRRVLAMHSAPIGTGDRRVFAVGQEEGVDQLRVAMIDPEDGAIAQTLFIGLEGYHSSTVGPAFIYITHGNAFISTINLQSLLPQFNLGGAGVEFTSVSATARQTALVVSRLDEGMVAEHNGFTSMYTPVLTPARNIRAVGTFLADSEDDGYVMLAYDDRMVVYRSPDGGLPESSARTFSIEGSIRELHTTVGGYAFGSTNTGSLLVFTDRPWVDDLMLSAERVITGDILELSFTTDTEGTYEVALGGTYRQGGEILASGSAAPGSVEIELPVTEWSEGFQRVFVRLTDSRGRIGHAGAELLVDSRPRAPALSQSSVTFDDRRLRLAFPALAATDIERYTLYVTTEPFSPQDYEEGGPSYVGPDDLDAPIEVPAPDSATVSVEIAPVTNDLTYYLAVRATDEAGLEGAMSDVVQGRPRPTQSASQLAGEGGGFDCDGTGGVRGATALGLGLGALLLRTRRRGGAILALGLAVGLAFSVPVAHAADEDGDGVDDRLQLTDDFKGDLTEAWANIQVRYGIITLRDESLTQVYGAGGNNVLHVEFGPQIYRFLELNFGAGLFQELGFTVDSQGNPGSRRTMITAVPLAVSPTLRLHFIDEQFIVPYASAGLDWWLWNEQVDSIAGGKDGISGSKFGYHWSLGANLLLDTFSRDRASMLEAQTGINDTWLTFEYRRQFIEGEQGFSFSGDIFTAGLKIDF
ncbi:MAG: hypothetical protein EA397_12025 [Deltaproteobacteria bacterium]|nr:MAG: hypothetical protein EA397_12025 [Deltaproteobacteria bacterium]